MKNTSKNIKEKLTALKEQYIKTAQAEFKSGTDELFAQNPELKSFGFKAYTPYFNDGSECKYSVYTEEPDINGEDGDEILYNKEEKYKSLKKLQKSVAEFLGQFDDDVFKEIIGDHVKVTITAKGIDTDDYEHD